LPVSRGVQKGHTVKVEGGAKKGPITGLPETVELERLRDTLFKGGFKGERKETINRRKKKGCRAGAPMPLNNQSNLKRSGDGTVLTVGEERKGYENDREITRGSD